GRRDAARRRPAARGIALSGAVRYHAQAMPDPAAATLAREAALGLAAALAGAVNSVAGGGTLLTFPTLIGLGLDAVGANATSPVGLVFGPAGSVWGYRREFAAARAWVPWLLPSALLGGAAGAWLLLVTPPPLFARLVPSLILGATMLFMLQEP